MTLPIQVIISPGRRENSSTAVKKTAVNTSCASAPEALPSSGETPATNEVVAQRGMAKKGPMVRYSAQVSA